MTTENNGSFNPRWKATGEVDSFGRLIIDKVLTKNDIDEMIQAGLDPATFNYHQVHEMDPSTDYGVVSLGTGKPETAATDLSIADGLIQPFQGHLEHVHFSLQDYHQEHHAGSNIDIRSRSEEA